MVLRNHMLGFLSLSQPDFSCFPPPMADRRLPQVWKQGWVPRSGPPRRVEEKRHVVFRTHPPLVEVEFQRRISSAAKRQSQERGTEEKTEKEETVRGGGEE